MTQNKASNKLDMNDEEMGLRESIPTKTDNSSDIQITNEKKQKDEHRKAPPRPDESAHSEKLTQPLLDSETEKNKSSLNGAARNDETRDDTTGSDHAGIDDGLLDPEKHGEDKRDGSVGTNDNGSSVAHHEMHDDGVNTEDGKWLAGLHGVDETDFYYDGYMANGIHNRLGEDRPGSPMMSIPDVNTYQQKKNLAQGMMDLALLSANANQLRYVLESSNNHPYYFPSLVFISCSIILQIGVGVGLIMNSRYNVKDDKDICKADKINNMTVLGIFLITIVNVFITSFSVASPTSTALQTAG